MTWICDGKSTAVLIYDEVGRLLAHTRATAPDLTAVLTYAQAAPSPVR